MQIYLDYRFRPMRQLLSLSIFLCCSGFAQTNETCVNEALEILKKNYNRGMKILSNPFVAANGKELRGFIECDDYANTVMSLETVIHEAIHFIDASNNLMSSRRSFYLVNDSTVSVALAEQSLEAIQQKKLNLIYPTLSDIEQGDMGYADNYLKGDIGNQDFFSLLGELNAYANGLDASIHLPRLPGGYSSSALAGPLAMAVFTLRYYEYFEKHDPDFFAETLMDKKLLVVVRPLLKQALDKVKEGRQFSDLQANVEIWEQALQTDQHQRMLKLIIK